MDQKLLDRFLCDELSRRAGSWQLRQRQAVLPLDSTHIQLDGLRCINFASNNYLGLTHHPRILAAARSALDRGAGAGASPLVSGYTAEHAAAETAIARWKGAQSAILLPSGYQTAHAVIQTLAAIASFHPAGVRFLLDKLCHASLIDAVGSTRAVARIFPHNGLAKLQRLVRDAPPDQLQVILTESIFSMDGDAADLPGLAQLKRQHPFILILDEAHATGVYGPAGAGYAAELQLADVVDVSIVTFSKAAGISGGAACGSRAFCDALVNWGRAYIYSTAIPPCIAAAIHAAIDVMRDEPQRQSHLRSLAQRTRLRLTESGLKLPPGDSPIIPIIVGSDQRAIESADALRREGIFVVAIRPPTVARGMSRLRITLSCDHTNEEIDRLTGTLARMAPTMRSGQKEC